MVVVLWRVHSFFSPHKAIGSTVAAVLTIIDVSAYLVVIVVLRGGVVLLSKYFY
jgi:hypothetical protein